MVVVAVVMYIIQIVVSLRKACMHAYVCMYFFGDWWRFQLFSVFLSEENNSNRETFAGENNPSMVVSCNVFMYGFLSFLLVRGWCSRVLQ